MVPPRNDLERTIAAVWRRRLGVARVGVHDNFFDLGGHSGVAVRMFAELRKILRRDLPLAILFEAPTVAELAAAIQRDGWQPAWSPLVLLRPGGAAAPLYLVHAVGGNIVEYHDLVQRLSGARPVFALQAVGLDGTTTPHTTIEAMATHYIEAIRLRQPAGPYHIGGVSFGGVVAFEMARQLAERGERVGVIALLDSSPSSRVVLSGPARVRTAVERAAFHARHLLRLPPGDKLAYVRRKARTVQRRVTGALWRLRYRASELSGLPVASGSVTVHHADWMAFHRYRPGPFAGRATLFRAADQGVGGTGDPLLGWGRWALGGVDAVEIPGDHLSILQQPGVTRLARELDDRLRSFDAAEPQQL